MYSDDFSAFTEIEISSGVPSFIDGCEPEARTEQLDPAKQEKFTKALSGIDNPDNIKAVAIKLVHKQNIDAAVRRFAMWASIKDPYIDAAKQKHCIQIVVLGFLRKLAKIKVRDIESLEASTLEQSLKINILSRTVYDRVRDVQQYLHFKVDSAFGNGVSDQLPPNHMKNILSTIRLHLNLSDLENNNEEKYADIYSRSVHDSTGSKLEEFDSYTGYLTAEKIISMDKIPLLEFSTPRVRAQAYKISSLEYKGAINDFKRSVISICAKKSN